MTENEIRMLIETESQRIQEAAVRLINNRLEALQTQMEELAGDVQSMNAELKSFADQAAHEAIRTDDAIKSLRYEMQDVVKEEMLRITRAQVARIMREENNG